MEYIQIVGRYDTTQIHKYIGTGSLLIVRPFIFYIFHDALL